MRMLEKLGKSLREAIRKLARSGRVDEAVVNEVVRDIQRALLQSDVNVKQVMELSKRIKERALKEEPLKGMTAREHVLRVIYQELVNLIGKPAQIELKPQKILMVGLQGSGKTTTTAKLARYFQKRGLRTAVICADNFRPGAYEQLKQLAETHGIPFYGEKNEKNAVKIVKNALENMKEYEVKIIDTAGRHALEEELIEELKNINKVVNPDHKFLVLDAAIGQLAKEQAEAFHKAVGITGIIVTKLDGTAKGGGALSAISVTGAPVAFVGTGERIDDLERFDPDSFISRLLGIGDLKGLIEKFKEIEMEKEIKPEEIIQGRLTLKDIYAQLEAMNRIGPLKQIIQMLPFGSLGFDISDEMMQVTEEKLRKYKYIMDSMTEEELENPKIINSSRIKRIARGSGTTPEDVKELLKYYRTMSKALKGLKGGRVNLRKAMKHFRI
jgi:signal recognition particle subunit SRP54